MCPFIWGGNKQHLVTSYNQRWQWGAKSQHSKLPFSCSNYSGTMPTIERAWFHLWTSRFFVNISADCMSVGQCCKATSSFSPKMSYNPLILILCVLPKWRSFAENPFWITRMVAVLSCWQVMGAWALKKEAKSSWAGMASPNNAAASEIASAFVVDLLHAVWRLDWNAIRKYDFPLAITNIEPDVE